MLNQVRFRDEFHYGPNCFWSARIRKQKPQLQGFGGERCDITVPPKLAVKYPWLGGAMNSNRDRHGVGDALESIRRKVSATGSLGYG